MSQPPTPSPLPVRYRPSGWWFVVGGALVLVAVLAGIALFVWTLSPLLRTDATVPTDGRTHWVSVDDDGTRMLWRDEDVFDPGCRIVDAADGEQIDLRPVTSQISKDVGDGEWTAAYRFEPGSGELEVTCAARVAVDEGGSVQIGPAPTVGGVVGGMIATIAVPSLLGLAGLAVLVVTGILSATRPERPRA